MGCACIWAKINLDNYVSVIYDTWSLEIQRNDITHGVIKRTLGMVWKQVSADESSKQAQSPKHSLVTEPRI